MMLEIDRNGTKLDVQDRDKLPFNVVSDAAETLVGNRSRKKLGDWHGEFLVAVSHGRERSAVVSSGSQL
jgi:hypothetical protein